MPMTLAQQKEYVRPHVFISQMKKMRERAQREGRELQFLTRWCDVMDGVFRRRTTETGAVVTMEMLSELAEAIVWREFWPSEQYPKAGQVHSRFLQYDWLYENRASLFTDDEFAIRWMDCYTRAQERFADKNMDFQQLMAEKAYSVVYLEPWYKSRTVPESVEKSGPKIEACFESANQTTWPSYDMDGREVASNPVSEADAKMSMATLRASLKKIMLISADLNGQVPNDVYQDSLKRLQDMCFRVPLLMCFEVLEEGNLSQEDSIIVTVLTMLEEGDPFSRNAQVKFWLGDTCPIVLPHGLVLPMTYQELKIYILTYDGDSFEQWEKVTKKPFEKEKK
ncbi:hypothetical protein B7494_g380 [Chlorociboria aeruginascens]|nr:hypothetical protein B7494_g380 [Chlorociboria aeruginascens]